MPEETNINAILQQESVIAHVFDLLIDDGLQEYRLACKAFYEATKRYGVHVSVKRLSDLEMVVDRYPMARALTFGLRKNVSTDIAVREELASMRLHSEYEIAQRVVQRLTSMRNLRCLKLRISENTMSTDDWDHFLAAMHRLESLEIGVEVAGCRCPWFNLRSLQHLTGLTSLAVLIPSICCTNEQSIPELTALQELVIDPTLFKIDEITWTFPSLTALTSLNLTKIRHLPYDMTPTRFYAFPLAMPYAGSLQTILFCNPFYQLQWEDFNSLLNAFSQLNSLTIQYGAQIRMNVVEALEVVTSLTELRIRLLDRSRVNDLEALTQLSSLKSLSLSGPEGDLINLPSVDFRCLSQLTNLFLRNICYVPFLESIQTLRELYILRNPTEMRIPIPPIRLPPLRDMERLSVFCESSLPADAVLQAIELRRLALHCKFINADLMDSLVTLTKLTKLSLRCSKLVGNASFATLNHLTSLISLSVAENQCSLASDPIVAFFRGTLVRLRYLTIGQRILSAQQIKELKSRFPSLRKLKMPEQEKDVILKKQPEASDRWDSSCSF